MSPRLSPRFDDVVNRTRIPSVVKSAFETYRGALNCLPTPKITIPLSMVLLKRRSRLLGIVVLLASLVGGCSVTNTWFPSPSIPEHQPLQIVYLPPRRQTAQERLLGDGKVLYEAGRVDEARKRLELLLTQSADEHLRRAASNYLNRIEKGLAPEPADPRVPRCFGGALIVVSTNSSEGGRVH
jgi:hypothetical protein